MSKLQKKFSALRAARFNAKLCIADLEKQLESIKNDLSILTQDKANLTKLHTEKLQGKVDEEVFKMGALLSDYYREAKEAYNKSREVESIKLTSRAAILSPLLAAMSNEDLLTLYPSRHANKIDRLLLDEVLSLRVESNYRTGEVLGPKFEILKKRLRHELPENEQAALDELDAVDLMDAYTGAVYDEVNLSVKERSKSLKLEESVKRTRCKTDADNIEKHFLEG